MNISLGKVTYPLSSKYLEIFQSNVKKPLEISRVYTISPENIDPS